MENDTSLTFRLLRDTESGKLSEDQSDQRRLAESDPSSRQAAILVADDSDALRSAMVQMFHALGYGFE